MPEPLELLVLVLAAYRLTRLGGWDDWPPIYKLRAWVIGEHWVPLPVPGSGGAISLGDFVEHGAYVDEHGETQIGTPPWARSTVDEPELPGKQPGSEAEAVRPAYRRPTLAHLVHCPFCLGWWVSLACVAAFWVTDLVLYPLLPFAVSGAVGLVAKNLDP